MPASAWWRRGARRGFNATSLWSKVRIGFVLTKNAAAVGTQPNPADVRDLLLCLEPLKLAGSPPALVAVQGSNALVGPAGGAARDGPWRKSNIALIQRPTARSEEKCFGTSNPLNATIRSTKAVFTCRTRASSSSASELGLTTPPSPSSSPIGFVLPKHPRGRRSDWVRSAKRRGEQSKVVSLTLNPDGADCPVRVMAPAKTALLGRHIRLSQRLPGNLCGFYF